MIKNFSGYRNENLAIKNTVKNNNDYTLFSLETTIFLPAMAGQIKDEGYVLYDKNVTKFLI